MGEHEYEARWERVRDQLQERDLDGVIVWSRGGGPIDCSADVLYLAGHSSPFPMIADLRPHWAGRAHSAFFLGTDGEPSMVVEQPDWRRDRVPFDDVRFALDVPGAAADLIGERAGSNARIGLVGRSSMLASVKDALLEASPGVEYVLADDLVERIRAVKSPYELDLLRASAAVGDAVVGAVIEAALQPGTTEAEAVAAGYAVGIRNGMAPYDAGVASGPNSDYYAYGQVPSWTGRELVAGDIFHIDTYGAVEGYLYDFARCCVTGGAPSDAQRDLMEGVIAAIEAGVAIAAPGVTAHAMYSAVHDELAQRGLAPQESGEDADAPMSALSISFPAHGHSYGLYWEKPWFVPGNDEALVEGMCIGIEGMGGVEGVGSAKFEQDVIITADGCELITKLETHYW